MWFFIYPWWTEDVSRPSDHEERGMRSYEFRRSNQLRHRDLHPDLHVGWKYPTFFWYLNPSLAWHYYQHLLSIFPSINDWLIVMQSEVTIGLMFWATRVALNYLNRNWWRLTSIPWTLLKSIISTLAEYFPINQRLINCDAVWGHHWINVLSNPRGIKLSESRLIKANFYTMNVTQIH